MIHTQENIAQYIKECVCENNKYGMKIPDNHINLLAAYIRMQMTHAERLEVEKNINSIVNDLQNKLDKGI